MYKTPISMMTNTTKISAVVFDIGGVLIELDGLPSIARLLDSDLSHDVLYKRWMAAPSVIAHETGKLSPEAFSQAVVQEMDFPLSAEAFMENFVSWIVDVFPNAIQLVKDLSERCTVAALSNTSAPHWERVANTGLAQHFDHLFLSHEIGHLKPHPASFQTVLDQLSCPASEVVFFDDNLDNVNAAIEFGFYAHQVVNPDQAKSLLNRYAL